MMRTNSSGGLGYTPAFSAQKRPAHRTFIVGLAQSGLQWFFRNVDAAPPPREFWIPNSFKIAHGLDRMTRDVDMLLTMDGAQRAQDIADISFL